jgi:hypothetical protein
MNKENFKYMLNIYILALRNQRVKSTLENAIKYQGQILVTEFDLDKDQQAELLEFVSQTFERCGFDWIINRPKLTGEGESEYPELSQKAVCLWYVYIVGLKHLKVRIRKEMDKLVETIGDEKTYEEVIDATAYDWVVSFLPYDYTYSQTIVEILFGRFGKPMRRTDNTPPMKKVFK